MTGSEAAAYYERLRRERRAERPCGCCPYCGALPGHQNPPTGEVWQHQHSPVREPMRDAP